MCSFSQILSTSILGTVWWKNKIGVDALFPMFHQWNVFQRNFSSEFFLRSSYGSILPTKGHYSANSYRNQNPIFFLQTFYVPNGALLTAVKRERLHSVGSTRRPPGSLHRARWFLGPLLKWLDPWPLIPLGPPRELRRWLMRCTWPSPILFSLM